MEVIPRYLDLPSFRAVEALSREEVRRSLGLTGRRVLVYVGALGGWYLTERMAEFLAVAHRQEASTFSMILTQSPPGMITERLRGLGVGDKDYFVGQVSPGEVPRYLKASDVALSFIKPCYSKRASSPTKVAEYLASGLPVVCNAGIGDIDQVIEGNRVGVLLRQFDREAYFQALRAVEELRRDGVSDRCRAAARQRFDLEKVGGARYLRLYRRVLRREGDRRSCLLKP